AARGAVRDRRVLAAEERVAGVGRAGVPVIASERSARGADARLAGLGAVARVTVAARGAVRDRCMLAAEERVAGVGRADVAVIAVKRGARLARARDARLQAVADVAVAALVVRDAGLTDPGGADLASGTVGVGDARA